jgi:rhodanese-related sulfurtransferase
MSARISPAAAHAKMTDEGYTYVDVRTPDEFAAGHPAGAVNVPFSSEFLPAMEQRFAKDAPIIVGCQVGARSARAAQALAAAGFTHVFDQRAGWDGARGPFGELVEPGWSRCGLP